MKHHILILSALFFSSLGLAQTFNGDEDDINQILENTKLFSGYIMASDYEGIANSYTEDAKIFPNRRNIIAGNAIKAYWILPENVSITHHKVTQEEIIIVEDTAYDYGYYEGKTQNAKGEESTWKGKYVIVWKKVGDTWKMYLDIWNAVD